MSTQTPRDSCVRAILQNIYSKSCIDLELCKSADLPVVSFLVRVGSRRLADCYGLSTSRIPRWLSILLLTLVMVCPPVAFGATPLAQYVGQGNTFNTDGANWCADFAVHVTGDALPVEPSRSAKQLYTRFKAAGLLTTTPQPGDLVFWWRESPTSWKGHVGIVESVTADTITTVEGNVSNRVQRRTYPRQGMPKLLGFGKVARG